MKALIVLLVTAAYPVAAQAQLATTAADASASTSPLMTASSATSTCSISSDNGVTSLDWSWGASNSGASSIVGKGLRVTSTLSGAGGDPVVSAHAIKTKGAGGVDRSSSRAGPRQTQGATFGERYSATPTVCAHAITTKGAGADGRLTRANAGMAPRDLACHIRPGDGVTIFNPPPPSSLDKVSV